MSHMSHKAHVIQKKYLGNVAENMVEEIFR